MASELIPIELDLTEGSFYTIWAPSWHDGEDEWEAFLGNNEHILVFPTPGHLYTYCHTHNDHDLYEHPSWVNFLNESPITYLPAQAARYPLVDVMSIAAKNPTPDVLLALTTLFRLCKSIATASNLYEVEKFFLENPILPELVNYTNEFTGTDGFNAWVQILHTIYDHYDAILDTIDTAVNTVAVNEKTAQKVNDTILASFDKSDNSNDIAEESYRHSTPESDPELEKRFAKSIWAHVGIDPISISTDHGTVYTLRCYLGEKAVFLGNNKKIFAFHNPSDMVKFLDTHTDKHSMSTISTFTTLVSQARAGELDVVITADNTYNIKGLRFQIAQGPTKVNPYQLELAVELFSDLGRYQGNTIINDMLAATAPIGWFTDYALHHREVKKLAPPAPYDHEVTLWEELENTLISALTTP